MCVNLSGNIFVIFQHRQSLLFYTILDHGRIQDKHGNDDYIMFNLFLNFPQATE